MPQLASTRITPFLWFAQEAEEAARFYAGVFADSRIVSVTTMPVDSPSGPPGSVKVVDFELCGQRFTAMSASGADAFNHAVSFVVNCDTQDEVDHHWHALLEGGGHTEACGWLRDRYGVAWQIVPKALWQLMSDPDRARAARVAGAMMQMIKLDLAALLAAAEA